MFISKELLLNCATDFGIEPDDVAVDRFNCYAEMLVDYNNKVNLTAITDPDEIVIKHFGDSLALTYYSKIASDDSLADVGTGAGFPGVPTLIVNPGIKLTLFDAVNKKLDFLRFISNELELDINIVHMRAEDAGKDAAFREKFDFTTARAVAQLRILSEFCIPLTKVGGRFIAMKGSISDDEKTSGIAAFPKVGAKLYSDLFYNIHNGDERNIIIAEKISHTSPKYPRNMGQINKKPL